MNNEVNAQSDGHLYIVSPRGYSAYEIAVQNGFEGTEEEWLESLQGEQGETGPQGKSAYQVAVDNGYEGTEEEWVNSYINADNYYNKNEVDNIADKKVYYFDTVALMKSASLKVGDYVETKGYYSSGDGGNGQYEIVSGSYTDDGGSIISIGGTLYAKLIIKGNDVNVKQFGAYGDGIHDDSSVLQKVIDYSIQKNKTVVVSGLIKLDSVINISGATIRGNNDSRARDHKFDVWVNGVIKTYITTGGTNFDAYVEYLRTNNLTGIVSSAANIFEYDPESHFIIENVDFYGNLSVSGQKAIARSITPTSSYSTIRFKIDKCGFYFIASDAIDLIALEQSEILDNKFFWINGHAISVYNSDATKDRPGDYSNIINNYFHFIYDSAIYYYNTFRSSNTIVGNLFQYMGQYNVRMTFTFTDGLAHNTDVASEADLPACIMIRGAVNLSNNVISNTKIEDNNGEQIPAFLSIDTTMTVTRLSLKNNKTVKASVLTKSYMYDLNCLVYKSSIERSQSNVGSQFYRIGYINNNMSANKQLLDSGAKMMYGENYDFNAKTYARYGYEVPSKIYNQSGTAEQTVTINYSTLLNDYAITYPNTDSRYLPIMFMISMHSPSGADHSNKFGIFVLNVRHPSANIMKYKGYSVFGDISITFNDDSMDITVPAYKITTIVPVMITSGYPDYN